MSKDNKSIYLRYKTVSLKGGVIDALKKKNQKLINKKLLELVFMAAIIEVLPPSIGASENLALSLEEQDELLHRSLRYFQDMVALNQFQIEELRRKRLLNSSDKQISIRSR